MQIFSQLITFTSAPVSFAVTDANGNQIKQCSQIYIEPAYPSSSGHEQFIEQSGLSTGAGPGTAGVIKVLAPLAASGPQDFWRVSDHKGGNLIEISQFAADGTTGEKMRVTYFVA
jgi:hypothetical protein